MIASALILMEWVFSNKVTTALLLVIDTVMQSGKWILLSDNQSHFRLTETISQRRPDQVVARYADVHAQKVDVR
jgi:hypothetical protein